MTLIAAIWLGAYLLGSIPFGYLVARARGVDLFQAGSGNIGATNVGRVLGARYGILVFLLDFAKGALPVAIALSFKDQVPDRDLAARGWVEVGAGLAAFLGHLFPVTLGFRGGKGIATSAGVVVMLLPGPALGATLVWITAVAATGYVSLGSLAAVATLCALHLLTPGADDIANPRTLFCVCAAALIFIKHRGNIVRLMQGTESRIGTAGALRRVVHVLALGLWFGSAVFFTFVVTLSLFHTFEELGKKEERPAWFPLPGPFALTSAEVQGPKEQGSRAAGYAVGPLFHWYFLVSGVCAFIATWTSLAWSRAQAGAKAHQWRSRLLLAALVTVLVGWPLERKVTELREPRNRATDAYLRSDTTATLTAMREARSEFGRWHL